MDKQELTLAKYICITIAFITSLMVGCSVIDTEDTQVTIQRLKNQKSKDSLNHVQKIKEIELKNTDGYSK